MTLIPPPEERSKCYDNTKISTYKTCGRKYFLRHRMHWKPSGTGLALIFGLSWHDGQDIVWKHAKSFSQADLTDLAFLAFKKTWTNNGQPEEISLDMEFRYSPRMPSTAYEMYDEYTKARWRMLQECKVVAIEQPFAVPMPGLPGHWYIGRLDKVVDYNVQRLILEHKTTTAYATIGNFRTDYVDSWYMSAQVKGYEWGGNLYYEKVNGVWVDAALVHKKIHDAFKFIPVSHSFPLLEEWIQGTREWIRQISGEEDKFEAEGLTPDIFRKNEESCFGKYGPCEFIDICRTINRPDLLNEVPHGFVHEVWEPFSILGLDKIVKESKDVAAID
jgi:hypothetical protein